MKDNPGEIEVNDRERGVLWRGVSAPRQELPGRSGSLEANTSRRSKPRRAAADFTLCILSLCLPFSHVVISFNTYSCQAAPEGSFARPYNYAVTAPELRPSPDSTCRNRNPNLEPPSVPPGDLAKPHSRTSALSAGQPTRYIF